MKLSEACRIGKDCQLKTVKEAYDNITIHSINFFPYSELEKEIRELRTEITERGVNPDDLVEDYLGEKDANIDA